MYTTYAVTLSRGPNGHSQAWLRSICLIRVQPRSTSQALLITPKLRGWLELQLNPVVTTIIRLFLHTFRPFT